MDKQKKKKNTYTHMHVHIHPRTNELTRQNNEQTKHACTHTHTYTYAHTHTHTHIYIYIYVCMYRRVYCKASLRDFLSSMLNCIQWWSVRTAKFTKWLLLSVLIHFRSGPLVLIRWSLYISKLVDRSIDIQRLK